MKKLVALLIVSIMTMGGVFAQYPDVINTNEWLRSLPNSTDVDPLAIERAPFFQVREKGKGNIKNIVTELDFALKHDGTVNDKWHSLYWIEIKRTVTFKNIKVVDEKDPMIDLGFNGLQINEHVFNITQEDLHIAQKTSGAKVIQVIRIVIDRETFDSLGNRKAYSYHVKAKNFSDKKVSLSAKDSAQFSNAISRITYNRELREENQKP